MLIARKPDASQSSTPACMIQVAQVCLSVWGVTPSSPARLQAAAKLFFDVGETLPTIVEHVAEIVSALPGSPEVRKQSRWDTNFAALLIGDFTSRRIEIDQTCLEINLRPAQGDVLSLSNPKAKTI